MNVAIVLGAAVRPDGTPSATLALRVTHAVGLHRTGQADLLIFTGAAGRHGPPESHVARDLAIAQGIPADAIRIETASRTTLENLIQARTLLPQGATIILVSNRWHLPRARLAARLLGLRTTGSGPRATAGKAATARAILREAVATPLTMLRALQSRVSLRSARRSGR
ncbi:MAG: YdcF family protein [Pseudomonadota bacterium]